MSQIEIEQEGAVALIWLHNPPANYFNLELITALAAAYADAGRQLDTRAIILAARGKHFCAGADFSQASADPDAAANLYEQAARLFDADIPVIAVVQGGAIGGGLGLALSADFRVATTSSWFTANFSKLGFTPGFGITTTLPRVVGDQRAAELMLTGRRVHGEEAERIGLVDRLAGEDSLLETARDLANDIAGSAPLAVASLLQTIRGPRARALRDAIPSEVSEQTRLRQSADFVEGIAAARERRQPIFIGR